MNSGDIECRILLGHTGLDRVRELPQSCCLSHIRISKNQLPRIYVKKKTVGIDIIYTGNTIRRAILTDILENQESCTKEGRMRF